MRFPDLAGGKKGNGMLCLEAITQNRLIRGILARLGVIIPAVLLDRD